MKKSWRIDYVAETPTSTKLIVIDPPEELLKYALNFSRLFLNDDPPKWLWLFVICVYVKRRALLTEMPFEVYRICQIICRGPKFPKPVCICFSRNATFAATSTTSNNETKRNSTDKQTIESRNQKMTSFQSHRLPYQPNCVVRHLSVDGNHY